MNKFLQTTACIGLIGLMQACVSSGEGTQTFSTIPVEVENVRNDVKLSDFAEVTIVPLPTSDSLLIGSVRQVRTSKEHICISDGKTIFRFTRQGEYAGRIHKSGKGPGEYAGINDFVMAADGNIWILPSSGKSLSLYAWDNSLQKEIAIEAGYSSQIHRMGDKIVLYNGNFITENSRHALQVIDLNTGKVQSRFLPINEHKARYLFLLETNLFTPTDKDTVCYFTQAHNDTVYRLTPNTFRPLQAYDWDGKNIPADYYNQDFPDVREFFESLADGKTYGTGFYLQSDSYQWVYFLRVKTEPCAAVISKDGTQQLVFNQAAIDQLAGFPLSVNSSGFSDNKYVTGDNEIIFTAEAMDIMEYVDEHAPESKEQVKQAIRFEAEDQNPVLLVVRLKE